jgi:hypothetical protein
LVFSSKIFVVLDELSHFQRHPEPEDPDTDTSTGTADKNSMKSFLESDFYELNRRY